MHLRNDSWMPVTLCGTRSTGWRTQLGLARRPLSQSPTLPRSPPVDLRATTDLQVAESDDERSRADTARRRRDSAEKRTHQVLLNARFLREDRC